MDKTRRIIAEHKELGEARTKAILLNRFWVLERSIDLEGADLIFQRSVTTKGTTDPIPPRFGVAQAKFRQSDSSTIEIPKEYVLDINNNLRKEFFLFVHTGLGKNASLYFLKTAQITQFAFDEARQCYRIKVSEIFKNLSLKVSDIDSQVLEVIDRILKIVDYEMNRRFISGCILQNENYNLYQIEKRQELEYLTEKPTQSNDNLISFSSLKILVIVFFVFVASWCFLAFNDIKNKLYTTYTFQGLVIEINSANGIMEEYIIDEHFLEKYSEEKPTINDSLIIRSLKNDSTKKVAFNDISNKVKLKERSLNLVSNMQKIISIVMAGISFVGIILLWRKIAPIRLYKTLIKSHKQAID